MGKSAALLVDHVLPVGYRQWVRSFPGPMAVRLGYDAPLLATKGRHPRDLHGNGTRSSSPQMRQQVRTKPSSKSPICGDRHPPG